MTAKTGAARTNNKFGCLSCQNALLQRRLDNKQQTTTTNSGPTRPEQERTNSMKKIRLMNLLTLSLALGLAPKVLAGTPTFTTIDYPGAPFTLAIDINFGGQIVGRYNDAAGSHGYLLSKGAFTTIDFPGAQGYALGINWQGDIVGLYFVGNKQHGYLFSGGAFTAIDFPGAAATEANGINAAGDIVGTYSQNSNGGGK